jgi:hypothetical protein
VGCCLWSPTDQRTAAVNDNDRNFNLVGTAIWTCAVKFTWPSSRMK